MKKVMMILAAGTMLAAGVGCQTNTGKGAGIAFFTRLRALDASGIDVLPATWSDNFVTLLAGERVEIVLEHEQGTDVAAVTAEPFNA